jgi:hypothetical protein
MSWINKDVELDAAIAQIKMSSNPIIQITPERRDRSAIQSRGEPSLYSPRLPGFFARVLAWIGKRF